MNIAISELLCSCIIYHVCDFNTEFITRFIQALSPMGKSAGKGDIIMEVLIRYDPLFNFLIC